MVAKVLQDYIGASEADQMHALSAAINARCEAKDAVVQAARELHEALRRMSSSHQWEPDNGYICILRRYVKAIMDAYQNLNAALAALDALPPSWQDETRPVRVEGGE